VDHLKNSEVFDSASHSGPYVMGRAVLDLADTTKTMAKKFHKRVAEVIATLRPLVQADGGDLELVSVNDKGVVEIRLHGACIGCPSSEMTLTMGIERNLKEQIPEVTRVVRVS